MTATFIPPDKALYQSRPNGFRIIPSMLGTWLGDVNRWPGREQALLEGNGVTDIDRHRNAARQTESNVTDPATSGLY
jgi:hypothetical protein